MWIEGVYYFLLMIFSGKWFKFQSSACKGYHDVLVMSIDINSSTVLNIYSFIIVGDDLHDGDD